MFASSYLVPWYIVVFRVFPLPVGSTLQWSASIDFKIYWACFKGGHGSSVVGGHGYCAVGGHGSCAVGRNMDLAQWVTMDLVRPAGSCQNG